MMKKLRKKFSFITKIMLVISLLFSNIAPLKVVFAYEKSDAIIITKTADNKLAIRYNEEIADVNLDLVVDETYTYLDGTTLVESNSYEDVLVDNLVSETGLEVESLLTDIKFDGTYNVVVKLERTVETETELGIETETELVAVNEYVEDVKFDVGLTSTILRDGVEVMPVNGVYTVKDGDVISSKFVGGELAPTWEYEYDGVVYTGLGLLELVLQDTVVTTNHLFGAHTYSKDVVLKSEHFDVDKEFNINLSLMYGSYADNDEMLNESVVANGYENILNFGGANLNGTLSIYPDLDNGTRVVTAYDLIKVVSSALPVDGEIDFVVSNGTEELQDKYTLFAATQTELTVTPEEFYAEYVVDENYYITISCEDLTIRYDILYFADVNGDNKVTVDDVLELVDKVLGLHESDIAADDVNKDRVLNIKDAVYLFEMISSKKLEVTLGGEVGTVGAKLEVLETNITSGDSFTVNYVVTVNEYSMNGIAGLFDYDKSALDLVSVNVNNSWMGNANENKFLYLGDEYLELGDPIQNEGTDNNDVVTDSSDSSDVTTENDTTEEGEQYPSVDYVVVTAKFVAKKAGEYNIELKDNTFISGVNTLKATNESISTVVVVNASNDNSLKSLVVGEQSIELVEGVYDYEITVSNDVETVLVEAVVNNLSANVTSIINPEKLVEGENTITITVLAENGEEKVYTVVVNREEAPEEEVEENVNYGNYIDSEVDDEEVTKEPVIKDNDEQDSDEEDDDKVSEDDDKLSRIIIIILILLVIAGLIYLIFKDDSDDDDTKKANKEVDKLKKENADLTDNKGTNNSKKVNRKTNNKERR